MILRAASLLLIDRYGGKDISLCAGGWYPVRLTMEQQEGGAWRLLELVEPGDGDDDVPSILSMCRGDREHAEPVPIDEAVEEVLAAQGQTGAMRSDR
ncbi:MAG: hypothetical protein IJ083_05975 [Clostridia bacterium]|nr:hypothetical protein [Clostridia bacterium]